MRIINLIIKTILSQTSLMRFKGIFDKNKFNAKLNHELKEGG